MELVMEGQLVQVLDNDMVVYTLASETVLRLMLAHKAESERVFTEDEICTEILRVYRTPAGLGAEQGDGCIKNKIAAIKRHREMTGSGLLEAKNYVEKMVVSLPTEADLRTEVIAKLRSNDGNSSPYIKAIQRHRELTGSTLLVARNYVETLQDELAHTDWTPENLAHGGI